MFLLSINLAVQANPALLGPWAALGMLAGLAVVVVLGVVVLRKVWGGRRLSGGEEGPEPAAKPTRRPSASAARRRGARQRPKARSKARPARERPHPKPSAKPEQPAKPVSPAEAEAKPEDVAPVQPAPHATLRDGLARTRKEGFIGRLRRLLSKNLAPEVVDEMEEILLGADIGVHTANRLLDRVRDRISRREIEDGDAVLDAMREEVRAIFTACAARDNKAASAITSHDAQVPRVILMVGVNGTGKTTTLGKLAWLANREGTKTLLVAADTFRAAAVDQLQVWGKRVGVPVHTGREGADPASVVFDGIRAAREAGSALVLCDTAGRLHTQANLIEELKKIVRVAGKARPGAPDEIFLVLDATIGQNAVHQARVFTEALGVTGIVLTKLDGTARGGVVLGIVDQLKLPIRYAGVGEGVEDLRPFDPDDFVEGLFAKD